MQSRASVTSLVDEVNANGNGHSSVGTVRNGAGGKGAMLPKPRSNLVKVFCVFLLLFVGVGVGLVFGLHFQGALNTSMLSSYMNTAVPSQQHYHLHIVASQTQTMLHGISDAELLWRASMVPMRPGLPMRRTPKVAFMFLTKGPLPLGPLWEKFFRGHQDFYSIYVHALPNYEPSDQPSSVFFGRHILSRVRVSLCLPAEFD